MKTVIIHPPFQQHTSSPAIINPVTCQEKTRQNCRSPIQPHVISPYGAYPMPRSSWVYSCGMLNQSFLCVSVEIKNK